METKKQELITIIKYLCSEGVVLFACIKNNSISLFFIGSLELIIIFALFNLAFKRFKRVIVIILNSLSLFLFNMQMVVLAFANTTITIMMLTSINSVQDLEGKKIVYITGILMALISSVIPIVEIHKFCRETNYIIMALVIMLFLCFHNGFKYSSFFGYYSLINQKIQSLIVQNEIKNGDNKENYFYKEDIKDFYRATYTKRNSDMPEKPNVILIFTEGLSQSIIDDDKDIMPTIRFMENNSICFDGYYNHTFATYRGLSGQLFSGYQLSDLDINSLTSMQDIFADVGYKTLFINTEPHNGDFTLYLNKLGFDEIISDDSNLNGVIDTVSDKDAYELLINTALEYNKQDTPFFLTIYTFGTHTSFDTKDEAFGDGTSALLNRFYNVDFQFSNFMEKFRNSSLYDNTVIVFTSDHATFQDDSFNDAFPDYKREHTEVDEIPFFIYYHNVASGHIDVDGRNSLDLAPTIFDFLDISSSNSFLGCSLFSTSQENNCEYFFTDSSTKLSTKGKSIKELTDDELTEFDALLKDYYMIKSR